MTCWMLRPDTAHLQRHGVTYDLRIEPFAGWSEVFFAGPDAIQVQEPIVLRGNVSLSLATELPVVHPVAWPVMSRRMAEILLSRGRVPKSRLLRIRAEAVPGGGARRDDLVMFHLLELTDAIDRSRSEYVPHQRVAGAVRSFRRLELTFADGEAPRVFRLKGYPGPLLVSESARVDLEEAGVKGCVYVPSTAIQ